MMTLIRGFFVFYLFVGIFGGLGTITERHKPSPQGEVSTQVASACEQDITKGASTSELTSGACSAPKAH